MLIFINLLAATTGGQVTRAKAFLRCAQELYPDAAIIVLKSSTSLEEVAGIGPCAVVNIKLGSRFKALKRMIWENIFLPSLVAKSSPNVYITFSHYLPFKKFDIPTLVGVSNLAPFSKVAIEVESCFVKIKMWILKKAIISSVNKASSVLALSETCKETLVDEGVAAEKIFVAPNGVDEYWAEDSEKMDFKVFGIQQPFMLYTSNFHRYKNHKILIEAYRLLPEKIRNNYQMVFIGKPDSQSYFRELNTIVKGDKRLDGRVIIIPGSNSRVLRCFYQQTALFLFPSLIENSPNILLEAMMAGALIMSSKLVPMTEFYGSGGAYFDPFDPIALSQEMVKILHDEKLSSGFRGYAQTKAREYTWIDFTQKVMDESYRLNSIFKNQEL